MYSSIIVCSEGCYSRVAVCLWSISFCVIVCCIKDLKKLKYVFQGGKVVYNGECLCGNMTACACAG